MPDDPRQWRLMTPEELVQVRMWIAITTLDVAEGIRRAVVEDREEELRAVRELPIRIARLALERRARRGLA